MNGGTKRGIDYAAWAGVIALILGAVLTFYGRFAKLEARMDEADQDRHIMMESLERIEEMVSTLEAETGDKK